MVGAPTERVLVTRRITKNGLELMAAKALVEVSPHERPLTPEELQELSRGCRVVVTMLGDEIGRTFLEARPEVGLIANYAVGLDNVDLDAARERGVLVTHTPGVLTEATADYTITLMLALMRRLLEGEQALRAGRFKGAAPLFMLGSDPRGKTLGIYGMGRIGEAVAQRALAFGMRIIYHNRHPRPEAERALGAELVSFDELLARAEVISINAPLNEQSRGVFNYQAFQRMRPGAFLVNTGRGPIVREEDLARALEDGLLRGAALDVYEQEPRVHPKLLELPGVILSPHLASATKEVREAMAALVAASVIAFLEGREPPNRAA